MELSALDKTIAKPAGGKIMSLNKPSGNMYPWITGLWNPVKGECPYCCSYCYVRRMMDKYGKEQKPLHLDEKELRTDLGQYGFIFVCSGCDLFHQDVSDTWIGRIADYAKVFDNRYLWHTKNPQRYLNWRESFGKNDVLCVTIETNFHIPEIMGEAPAPVERAKAAAALPVEYRRMITVEPIMKFDLENFSRMILCAQPDQVNIGADSGNNRLPEPTAKEIKSLIQVLEKHTKVVLKGNLSRIMKE
jgi:DNA repair photolyase